MIFLIVLSIILGLGWLNSEIQSYQWRIAAKNAIKRGDELELICNSLRDESLRWRKMTYDLITVSDRFVKIGDKFYELFKSYDDLINIK